MITLIASVGKVVYIWAVVAMFGEQAHHALPQRAR